MAYKLPEIDAKTRPSFDTIIDVRSPSEFARDHIPGAINLPALNDAERSLVGTTYTRKSRFLARRMGAAMVARNVAHYLDTMLVDKPPQWKPLIYCWRGGQRSGSFALVLRQIGWNCDTLDGGYRSYRRKVNAYLYDRALRHRIVLLDGQTGTGKTEILEVLAGMGHQVLDLENFARHRGSIFGAMSTPQPHQKMFESHLAAALGQFRTDKPTFIEAESSKIGERIIPPSLWNAMRKAPRIRVNASLNSRAHYTLRRYHEIISDPKTVTTLLDHMRRFHGHAKVDTWQQHVANGNFAQLASELIADHYDPRYSKSRANYDDTPETLMNISIQHLDPAGIARAAETISSELEQVLAN